MDCNIIGNINNITREQWLQLRKTGIGGSDAAAVCGLSQWATPLTIYLEKVSDKVEEIDNEYIEWGRILEPIIRDMLPQKFEKKTGCKIQAGGADNIFQSKENHFMLANLDGTVIFLGEHYDEMSGLTFNDGDVVGLEIKTASAYAAQKWKDDNLPDNYYMQLQHYMSITGLKCFMIAALIDKKLHWKFVPRNEFVIKKLIDEERNFWENHVLCRIPPEPIGGEADGKAIKMLYPTEAQGSFSDLSEMENEYERYKALTEEKKRIESEIEAIKQRISFNMGESETGLIGSHKVTYKTIKRKGYTVQDTEYRTLRIY